MHHVAARANQDKPLFQEPEDRRKFLNDLRSVIHRYAWRCHAYCLMGTHFHLLVYMGDATLSAGMARLCSSYA